MIWTEEENEHNTRNIKRNGGQDRQSLRIRNNRIIN